MLEKLSGDQVTGLIAADRAYDASVSPDGSKIAYVADTTLWVTDAAGTNERKLGTGFAGVGFGTILVRSTRQGGTTLTLLNADTTVRTTVAEPAVAKHWILTEHH